MVQTARFSALSGNGQVLNTQGSPQEKWAENGGGYISVGYFTATYDSYYINISNSVSSVIDMNWIALVKLA